MKTFLGAIALATAGCAAHSTPSHPTEVSTEQLAAQIDGLEAASGGRLGLALFSKDEGLLFAHRGAERFAMCSTFKLALAAMALETAGVREERLDFGEDDILSYAPYAKERAQIGWMSGLEAAHHAVTLSDNTAANLLLARLGGPEAFTAWLRNTGDGVTRLDRNEPTLNENARGDPRDTTTPEAKAELAGGDIHGHGASTGRIAGGLECRRQDRNLRRGRAARIQRHRGFRNAGRFALRAGGISRPSDRHQRRGGCRARRCSARGRGVDSQKRRLKS